MKPSMIPVEYGEVIYEYHGKKPNQLFIIGMSHRDSLTRVNGRNTSRVQAEVYKIGEWLIQNRGLELLLPEGYFTKKTVKAIEEKVKSGMGERNNCPTPLDMGTLEERLADNRSYVNAEMLLKENYPLRTRQIENEELYHSVGKNISKFVKSGKNSCDYLLLKSELDDLQERRIAAMLQRIPEIVTDEFRRGNIKERKAIFTIGMSHLHRIIKYLNENRIKIYSPLLASNKKEDYVAEMNLIKDNFGVSVILPKTLLEDQKILEINRLDKIITDLRRPSFDISSAASP